MMDDLAIRLIDDIDGFVAVEALQREVWNMDDLDVVPVHHLRAAANAGGVVLGAFTGGGELVGFSYAFTGLRGGSPLLISHMTGVRADHRGRGVGFALKRAQRDAALARGIDRVVWTFDPLQRANAAFNHHKLGAVASRYYVDYYGAMRDGINRGTESDRLEVDWWVADPRVDALMRGGDPDRHSGPARVEIPADFAMLKTQFPEQARAWRTATRQALLDSFAAGYEVVDFVQTAYILDRRTDAHARG
ncbi:MAG TPA: GNAT family N-acetyltransferase [bacterium]